MAQIRHESVQASAGIERFESIDELSRNLCATLKAIEPGTKRAAPPQHRPASRIVTRLLGIDFLRKPARTAAPAPRAKGGSVAAQPGARLTILDGTGRGHAYFLSKPETSVGRAECQDICLDFGDPYVSRRDHAFILFDREARVYTLRDGGKFNRILLNDVPVYGDEPLEPGDRISVGETRLCFEPA